MRLTIASIKAFKELDSVLTQLASHLPVDLMHGSHDPSNIMLPQQPLLCCIFPWGSHYQRLQCVTSPCQARVGGPSVVGTAGENTNDACMCSGSPVLLIPLENMFS